ncbi:MAG: SDR family NAD(P)-dependent oxidoreductase [Dongiaceae bacterium]
MTAPDAVAPPDLARLRGARVLVTGGAGLIGSHLADRLAEAGVAEIVVLDDLSRGRRESLAAAAARAKVTFVEGDIRDRATVAQACAGIDLLFHLAAIRLTQCAQEPRLAFEVMAGGTYNVLEAAVGCRVARVIAASSASIYGAAESFPIREDHHPYGNDTIYGATKVFGEQLLASFREMHGLDYLALRPFNVYGPRMDVKGAYTEVLVRWMERIAQGQPPVIFGAGTQTMDFVYVEDVARAFLLAAASPASGTVCNVATGIETSLSQLAAALLAAMGSHLAPEHGPERRVATVPRRWADTGRARRLLGFQAEIGLQEGLRRLVAWWRGQQGQPAG